MLAIGWLSDMMFQVTGASGRANGYGAPATPPDPYLCDVDAEELDPPLTVDCAPDPQAARTAESVGNAAAATADLLKNSRRLSPRGAFG